MSSDLDADMDQWSPGDVGRFLVNIGPGEPWNSLGVKAVQARITGAVLRARSCSVEDVMTLVQSLHGDNSSGGEGGGGGSGTGVADAGELLDVCASATCGEPVISRAVARSIHRHVLAFLHGVVPSFGSPSGGRAAAQEADVDLDAAFPPSQPAWAEGEGDVNEARELTPDYVALEDSSTRDMSECPIFPVPPSLLSHERWNKTKQTLFQTQPANGLCVHVARKMNAIQHYYAEQTAVVLHHGRKVAEMVALDFVPAAWVQSMKVAGRRVDLNNLADYLEDNRLLPAPVLDALRTLQLKGNIHALENDRTPDHHGTKPEVVIAVHTVRTRVQAQRAGVCLSLRPFVLRTATERNVGGALATLVHIAHFFPATFHTRTHARTHVQVASMLAEMFAPVPDGTTEAVPFEGPLLLTLQQMGITPQGRAALHAHLHVRELRCCCCFARSNNNEPTLFATARARRTHVYCWVHAGRHACVFACVRGWVRAFETHISLFSRAP
jgi:hypothetical protein